MKAYIKSYEEIKKVGDYFYSAIHHDNFSGGMKSLCGKGPFEFYKKFENNNEWFKCVEAGYNWHINWLKQVTDYQYLLEFE